MFKKKKNLLILVGCLVLVILVIALGQAFGFFTYKKKGQIVNVITINGIEVNILNESVSNNALNLENAYPMYDEEGLTQDPFEFSITNTSSKAITYTIKIVSDEDKMGECLLSSSVPCSPLSTDVIKFVYKKNSGSYTVPNILGSTNNNVIASGTINGKETINHSLKLWIDGSATSEIMNQYFFGKIIIEGAAAN